MVIFGTRLAVFEGSILNVAQCGVGYEVSGNFVQSRHWASMFSAIADPEWNYGSDIFDAVLDGIDGKVN